MSERIGCDTLTLVLDISLSYVIGASRMAADELAQHRYGPSFLGPDEK